MYARSRFGPFAPGQATPFTVTLLGLYVIFYVIDLATNGLMRHLFAFSTDDFPARFWTLLTWPLVGGGDPLYVVFALGWAYWFAGSMERAWGTRDFGVFFVLTNILAALGYWAGHFFLGPGVLSGLYIAAAPAALAWGLINQRETVSLFFLPIPGLICGIIGVAMAWFYAGPAQGNPLLGLLALTGSAAAYWYTTAGRYANTGYRSNRDNDGFAGFGSKRRTNLHLHDEDRPSSYSGRRSSSLDEGDRPRSNSLLRWWRDRQEKKRLEDIFRRSGFTDDDERR